MTKCFQPNSTYIFCSYEITIIRYLNKLCLGKLTTQTYSHASANEHRHSCTRTHSKTLSPIIYEQDKTSNINLLKHLVIVVIQQDVCGKHSVLRCVSGLKLWCLLEYLDRFIHYFTWVSSPSATYFLFWHKLPSLCCKCFSQISQKNSL